MVSLGCSAACKLHKMYSMGFQAEDAMGWLGGLLMTHYRVKN